MRSRRSLEQRRLVNGKITLKNTMETPKSVSQYKYLIYKYLMF
jgi:hypothetical protein